MDMYDYLKLAGRLQGIIRRSETFGPKNRDEILTEIKWVVDDLLKNANRLDHEMNAVYTREYAHPVE